MDILIITNHQSMIWIHIKDLNYILNNIIKFNMTPEKHFHHKQLIYHLVLLQISQLYIIQLKHYHLQLLALLKEMFLFYLWMILHIYINVQYILYYMIIKINIICINHLNYMYTDYFVLGKHHIILY